MPRAWVASKRLPAFLTCQPDSPAFECSATPNSQTLPSWAVVILVVSIAHMTIDVVVTMCRTGPQTPSRHAAMDSCDAAGAVELAAGGGGRLGDAHQPQRHDSVFVMLGIIVPALHPTKGYPKKSGEGHAGYAPYGSGARERGQARLIREQGPLRHLF